MKIKLFIIVVCCMLMMGCTNTKTTTLNELDNGMQELDNSINDLDTVNENDITVLDPVEY